MTFQKEKSPPPSRIMKNGKRVVQRFENASKIIICL